MSDLTTRYNPSPSRLDPPKWHRIEAGYYVRPIGLGRNLEIIHKNDTPRDWMYYDRWVIRTVATCGKPDIRELARRRTYREARAFADEWRAEQ